MVYIVAQKYYDNGKIVANIEEYETVPEGMIIGECIEYRDFDLWRDKFDNRQKAERFLKDCKKA